MEKKSMQKSIKNLMHLGIDFWEDFNLQRGQAASPPPCLSPGGEFWGVLRASWGRPGGVLGASWGRFGLVLGVLGRLGSVCGGGTLKIRRSFRNSPLLVGVLGASRARLGAVLGSSWESWGVLGASWGRLETSWGRLGAHFIANST